MILIHRFLSISPLHPSSFRLLRVPMLVRITVRPPHPFLFYTPLLRLLNSFARTRFNVISHRLLSTPSSIGLFLFRPDSIQDIISQKRNLRILALTVVLHLFRKGALTRDKISGNMQRNANKRMLHVATCTHAATLRKKEDLFTFSATRRVHVRVEIILDDNLFYNLSSTK